MRKNFLRIGGLLAALSVAVGAFGAHGLKNFVADPVLLDTFETAVRYQFYHTFAILLVAILLHFKKKKGLILAGWFFLGGIILFSGSLYILVLAKTLKLPLTWVGAITPLGGLAFIAAWIIVFASTYSKGDRYVKH